MGFKPTKHLASILWTVFIIILSFIKIPPSDEPQFIPHLDKIVHLFLYFTLGFIVAKEKWKWQLAWIFAVLLGGGIEILQGLLTTYRSADFFDFCCDVVGFAIGLYHNKLINIFK